MIIRSGFHLMNLHVVQLQYGFEFFRLSFCELLQTLEMRAHKAVSARLLIHQQLGSAQEILARTVRQGVGPKLFRLGGARAVLHDQDSVSDHFQLYWPHAGQPQLNSFPRPTRCLHAAESGGNEGTRTTIPWTGTIHLKKYVLFCGICCAMLLCWSSSCLTS